MEGGEVDWSGWAFFVALVAFVWSTLWGVGTFVWTQRRLTKAKQTTERRSENDRRREEFRDVIRTPMSAALSRLADVKRQIGALRNSHLSLEALKSEIGTLNHPLVEELGKVEEALSDANKSNFADGTEWLDGFGEVRDQIYDLMNGATGQLLTDDATRTKIAEVAEAIQYLEDTVKRQIERQL